MTNPQDASVAITPFGTYQYSNAYFDFMKTWAPSLSNNNISPTDWRIWLPRAFYLNWSDPQIMQKSMMDPTIWFPVALNPNKIERDQAIQHIIQIINSGNTFTKVGEISGIEGGVINVGSRNTIGDIKVDIDKSLNQNPNNEYLKGLKELTDKLDQEYENNKVPKEKQTEINNEIQGLAKEVEDIKPETKIEDLKPSTQKQIEAKTTTLVEKIVDAMPGASEIIVNLIPFLSPFSKLIRGGMQSIVDPYKK